MGIRAYLTFFIVLATCGRASAASPIVLESRLAGEMQLAAGDTVSLRLPGASASQQFVVSGFYTPPPDPAGISRTSRQAWTPLTDLERFSGRDDRVSRYVLALKPGANADSLLDALNSTHLGFHAYRARDVAKQSSQTFVVISNFHKAISILSILTGAAFLAAIVLLQVQELRRSLGVLRVIGISKRSIYTLVIGETVLLANVGAAAGVGVALLASRMINSYYRSYFATNLLFSSVEGWHVWLAFGIASLVGVVLGSIATTYLFKSEINEVLGR
ncbi:MAG TPA: FtsX-like permease family protein [Candidatus Krumholzibacteria bacterium]|nr:FtsX-like permease family protein [Candidatus Krumholzibacteria bacterium]